MGDKLRGLLFFLVGRQLLNRFLQKHQSKRPEQLGLQLADTGAMKVGGSNDHGFSLALITIAAGIFFLWAKKNTRQGTVDRRVRRAEAIFGVATALLPARIVNEELGDALEDIRHRMAAGRPGYEITLKTWGATFWVLFHSGTYALKRIGRAVSSFRSTS